MAVRVGRDDRIRGYLSDRQDSLFLLTQLEGLSAETPTHSRRQHSDAENQQSDGADACDTERRGADGMRRVWNHRRGRETGCGHSRVVHDGYGGPHHDRAGSLRPTGRFPILPKTKRQPQRDQRNYNREHN